MTHPKFAILVLNCSVRLIGKSAGKFCLLGQADMLKATTGLKIATPMHASPLEHHEDARAQNDGA